MTPRGTNTTSRTVEVIGGGPAGLYVARLLKLAQPSTEVVVHERLEDGGETFGFGVGLTEATMRNLAKADPDTADRIRAASLAGHTLDFRGNERSVTLHGARNLAIGRATLLGILVDAAREVGVDYRPGSRLGLGEAAADVVIAADGVRSGVRDKLSAELGVHATLGRSRFVWCGTDFAVDSAYFAARHVDEGSYVVHAYPYAADRSTFLIEVDKETWSRSQLPLFDEATPPGETDEQSVARLEHVFREDLRGTHLLTNRTRWSRFTTLSLDRWSTGNVVLIGDAAHTAHYTIGSGTKLALEDSIALAEALSTHTSISDAFATYEAARRPPVERFKRLAARSQGWWDSYHTRAEQSAERIALSYMTRAGNLGIADYAADQPSEVASALAELGVTPPTDPALIDSWVLQQPVDRNGLKLSHAGTGDHLVERNVETLRWSDPDAWGDEANHQIELLGHGHLPVRITGDHDPQSLGGRLDFAEQVRIRTSRAVLVDVPRAARTEAAAAVATGRCDAVVLM